MATIIFDTRTNAVVGYNTPKGLYQYELSIPNLSNLSKVKSEVKMSETYDTFGVKLYIDSDGLIKPEHNITDTTVAKPSLKKSIINSTVKFLDDPFSFNLNDVLLAYDKNLQNTYGYKNIITYVRNLKSIINMRGMTSGADVSDFNLRIHPNGTIKLLPIKLLTSPERALVITESHVGVHYLKNNDYTSSQSDGLCESLKSNTLNLTLVNDTDEIKEVSLISILY